MAKTRFQEAERANHNNINVAELDDQQRLASYPQLQSTEAARREAEENQRQGEIYSRNNLRIEGRGR